MFHAKNIELGVREVNTGKFEKLMNTKFDRIAGVFQDSGDLVKG
jgi:hypothetical protein